MSGKREHRQRLIEKNRRLEKENEKLADLLLLQEPPLICKIKRAVVGESPSAMFTCQLGRHTKHRKCNKCKASLARYFPIGFMAGYSGDTYCQALLKYLDKEARP